MADAGISWPLRLLKPLLFNWFSVISLKIFGISAFALRFPSLLASAALILLLFRVAWRERSIIAGVVCAILLISDHIFQTMSRIGMTDALVTFGIVVSIAQLLRDPKLESRCPLVVWRWHRSGHYDKWMIPV